jgi:hypothetical protein
LRRRVAGVGPAVVRFKGKDRVLIGRVIDKPIPLGHSPYELRRHVEGNQPTAKVRREP